MTGTVYSSTTKEKKENEENRGNRRTDISRKKIEKIEKIEKRGKRDTISRENRKYHIRGMARGNWIGRWKEEIFQEIKVIFSKNFALKKNTRIM